MTANDIQIGKKYWIKPDEAPARPVLVSRKSDTQPPWFLCVGAEGEGFVVFCEAFLRPVEPEPAGV
jgi:hypothetical protein